MHEGDDGGDDGCSAGDERHYSARLYVRGPNGGLAHWKTLHGGAEKIREFLGLAPLVAPSELLLCCLDPFEPDFRSGVVVVGPVLIDDLGNGPGIAAK